MPTYPASPTPATVKLTTTMPRNVTYTRSLRRVATSVGTQRFLFTLGYPPQTWANAAEILSFFAQVGGATTFTFVDPRYTGPRGSVSDVTTISMAAGGTQGETSIAASGFALSATGVLKSGDYLKFTGHNKIYVVLSDVSSDGSGNATITISPGLQADVTNSTEIFHSASDVTFTCAFASDSFSMDIDQSYFYGFNVDLEEVV